MPADHWLPREPRRIDGGEPAIEMRFHDEWWHTIFHTFTGHEVVLSPMGISLGRFATEDEAVCVAEDNARTRALNTLKDARLDIERAATVLGKLSLVAPRDGQANDS
jgi:hypothetical protein